MQFRGGKLEPPLKVVLTTPFFLECTCSSKFLNNFIKKALVLNNEYNTIYSTISNMLGCWPLGLNAK